MVSFAVFQVQCAVRLPSPSSSLGSQPIYLDVFPISHHPSLFPQYPMLIMYTFTQKRIMRIVDCHVSEHKTSKLCFRVVKSIVISISIIPLLEAE